MCIHTYKAYHCYHTPLSLRSLKGDRPSVNSLLSASYVAKASLRMEVGTASRVWYMGMWNRGAVVRWAPIGE